MFVAGVLFPSILAKNNSNFVVGQKQVIILPHLETAQDSRNKFLKSLDSQPTNVIILSTNHFNTSESDIIHSGKSWNLEQSVINDKRSDQGFESYVQADELVKADHGVRNILVDLAKIFPRASYDSFLVKSKTSQVDLDKLTSQINDFCSNSKNCLVVGSVDFSHYNPSSLAALHDAYSIKALQQDNLDTISNAETDSPEVLRIVKNLANNFFSLKNFSLYENSNSGILEHNLETETTSWVIGEFDNNSYSIHPSAQLMFAGDVMMDRLINHIFKDNFISIFDDLKNRVFAGVDASIANFEGPLSDGPVTDDISTNNLVFLFPFDSISALKYANFTGFTLANNHTLNDGKTGLDRTRQILNSNGFFTFGSPNTIDQFSVKHLDSDIKVSLIGINDLEKVNRESLGNLISSEKNDKRFVIVYPHWGNEYQASHSASQQQLAHLMIDEGADLVIGSHPHVVQDSEIYKGKAIFYSLGNFIFDQTFSTDTQRGLVAGISVTESEVRISLIPVESVNLKPRISVGENRKNTLSRALPKEFLNQLESGTIELNR